jgi:hypothetical protein
MGLPDIVRFFRAHGNVPVELIDLRNYTWIVKDDVWVRKIDLPGDPMGNTLADLGEHSAFHDAPKGRRFFGASYDHSETQWHHRDGRHQYSFSRSALAADVVVNLPKLKTHKKCGATISLKNLVGLNGNKNLLPHHSFGGPESGGDQFVRDTWKTRLEVAITLAIKPYLNEEQPLAQWVARRFKPTGYRAFGTNQSFVRSGNWYGNDTVWRMILDLNRILRFAAPDGSFRTDPKRYLSVVDGLIAGEGNGPVEPEPMPAGLLAVGTNPVAVDFACVRLMGFDYRKILHIARAFDAVTYPLAPFAPSDVHIISNDDAWSRPVLAIPRDALLAFRPHFGWTGHVELEADSV